MLAGQAGGRARRVVGDLAHDGARDVVGDVAAADHDDLAAEVERLAERHGAQQVDAAVDARPALAGNAEPARALRADGDEHRGVIPAQVGEGDVAARP